MPHGSIFSQYWQYLGDIVHGNFGVSYTYFPQSVASVIGAALPWTLVLVGVVTIIAFVVGTLLGVCRGLAAGRRVRHGGDRRLDLHLGLPATSGPALLLLFVFGFKLGWFPIKGGYGDGLDPELEPRRSPGTRSTTASSRR